MPQIEVDDEVYEEIMRCQRLDEPIDVTVRRLIEERAPAFLNPRTSEAATALSPPDVEASRDS